MITRPTEDRLDWKPLETNVDILDPAKQELGFTFREKLGSKVANWLFKRLSTWTNWTIDRLDAHETTGNVTMALSSSTFDDVQEFFDNLAHNDYAITITGGFTDATKTLRIEGITGKGTITFSGSSITIGRLIVKNVYQTSVMFTNEFGFNIHQQEIYGLEIKDVPNIYFQNLSLSFGVAPLSTITWRMLRVENANLTVYNFSANGEFTSSSTPEYLLDINKNANVNFQTAYTISTNATAGSAKGKAMILINKDASFDFSQTPTFTNWNQNFAMQVNSVVYPKTDFEFSFNIATSAMQDIVKPVIENLERVEGHIKILSPGTTATLAINMENISGSGQIEFSSVLKFDNSNKSKFKNILPYLNFSSGVFVDNAHITQPFIIENCINFKIVDATLKTISSETGECLKVSNSKGLIGVARVAIDSDVKTNFRYALFTNQSDIVIGTVNSSNFTTGDFMHFLRQSENSKLMIKNVVVGGTDQMVVQNATEPCILIAKIPSSSNFEIMVESYGYQII